jgi:hypothetical protein
VFHIGRVWLAINRLLDFKACQLQEALNFLRLKIEKVERHGSFPQLVEVHDLVPDVKGQQ